MDGPGLLRGAALLDRLLIVADHVLGRHGKSIACELAVNCREEARWKGGKKEKRSAEGLVGWWGGGVFCDREDQGARVYDGDGGVRRDGGVDGRRVEHFPPAPAIII